MGEKDGEVSKLVFYAQSTGTVISGKGRGKKRGDVSKKKNTKSPGKGKQIWVGGRELLIKYCWIVYKLQQWVKKPGKDDKARRREGERQSY